MKMQEALAIINGPARGFRVFFLRRRHGHLTADCFPDRDEELIPTQEEAWRLAEVFERKMGDLVSDVGVVDSEWNPATGIWGHYR